MSGPWCPSGTPYPELHLQRKKIMMIKTKKARRRRNRFKEDEEGKGTLHDSVWKYKTKYRYRLTT
jgi:hypothetical protein